MTNYRLPNCEPKLLPSQSVISVNTRVVLFAYSRPELSLRVLNSLLGNPEAALTDLVVYLDGPRNEPDRIVGDSITEMVKNLSGFRSVKLIRAEKNKGLAKSIVDGVTAQLLDHESVIVMEDDIEVAPTFLRYMNDGLNLYKDEEKVASIHAHVYPVDSELPETFFVRGADCWGWGTWRRAWQHFEPDGKVLLERLESRGLCRDFDVNGSAEFTRMLKDQIAGKNDSWAVRWHASTFLQDMVTLYPRSTQAINIGQDGGGSHRGVGTLDSRKFDSHPVFVVWQAPEPLADAHAAFKEYFLSQRPRFARTRLGLAIFRALQRGSRVIPDSVRVRLVGYIRNN